ncbi:hypothetical protein Taro_031374, partial [Colocasia esculenta]|nr:hypothetical protein [Colocasia esculenta]
MKVSTSNYSLYAASTFTILSSVAMTHSPNYQLEENLAQSIIHTHISLIRHLGNAVTNIGNCTEPGEALSTLTSGTCPPLGFHPNALRIYFTYVDLSIGTFLWYGSRTPM